MIMKLSSTNADVSHCRRSMDQSTGLNRVQRAAKWSPALLGAFAMVVVLAFSMIWLCIYGESFFSLTRRLPAEVLVVEGWIGDEGVRAAAAEFERGGYRYIVATGAQVPERRDPANYAEIAEQELIRLGIPQDKIIIAPIREVEHRRTFKFAVAAWLALQKRGIHPEAINVLTLGPHARRSRLVYAKVWAPDAQVGVIAWEPPYYQTEPWWRSIGRTKCFLKEIVGYPFEVLLNSGRGSSSPLRPT
jgi:hypothetical protein